MRESEIRSRITDIVMNAYLPKMKDAVSNYLEEAQPRQVMIQEISDMVGHSVGMQLGILRVAEPTNELIDNLVALYAEASSQN